MSYAHLQAALSEWLIEALCACGVLQLSKAGRKERDRLLRADKVEKSVAKGQIKELALPCVKPLHTR